MKAGSADTLIGALGVLREVTAAIPYRLETPGAPDARRTRDALVAQLDDYVVPRLRRLDAPLLAVVGGSTGAGKSTLVNSLVGSVVTSAGVLRPTTRSPVLVCHPDDRAAFEDQRVLPGLSRTTGSGNDHGTLQIVASHRLEPGLALLDAPDLDSVVVQNRELANQLLAAADLWLFVTTASRYADAVPWEALRTAASRGTELAVVLDRVPAGAEEEIGGHLGEMLRDHGLAAAPVFVVPEAPLADGVLPDEAVAPVRDWYTALAADADERAAVVRRTLDGALDSLRPRIGALRRQALAQAETTTALYADAATAYDDAVDSVRQGISEGTLLRGEVLARWHEFVGTGEFLRTLEARVGRLRDQLTAAVTGRPLPGRDLTVALSSGVALLVTAAAEAAAERTAAAWRGRPAGVALLAAAPDLGRASATLGDEVQRLVRDWQAGVLDTVRHEAGHKRTSARLTAYGVNATGLLVMVAVFASTHFILTGAEVAVATGTTVVSQKLLEALFGDQAVRRLADRARADLLDRVAALLDTERERFDRRVADVGTDQKDADRLRAAEQAVYAARTTALPPLRAIETDQRTVQVPEREPAP
ncbi:MAG TPA: ABC transporter [Mycobacteriales bacterium]|jgi:energy-coupling factor transporter ATP-binding protein EcfA2|nr:ABC transporter [Mycobacteriales bacterium]